MIDTGTMQRMSHIPERLSSASLLILYIAVVGVNGGFYIIADYYMDPSQSSVFGGKCRNSTQDDCAFVSSHMNPFSLTKYGPHKECWMTLDAGSTRGSRYRLDFRLWDLEPQDDVTRSCENDYVEFYDCNSVSNSSCLIGRFCGSTAPNLTSGTQRFLTVKFRTNAVGNYKGFRFLAIRTEPPPCNSTKFLCPAEQRCIDGRLRCDGTKQCVDGVDERDCSEWELFVGMFLALGLGGLVAVIILVIVGLVAACVILCCCTCCKRRPEQQTKVAVATSADAAKHAHTA